MLLKLNKQGFAFKLRIVSPILILLCVQLVGYFLYSGFHLSPTFYASLIVVGCYVCSILAIFAISLIYNVGEDSRLSSVFSVNKGLLIFIFFVVFFTMNIPSFNMVVYGVTFGFDMVRQNYFSNDDFKSAMFGSVFVWGLARFYIVYIVIFFIVMLIDAKDRFQRIAFYYFLFSLVVFGVASAGRFYIYYMILILFYRTILLDNSIIAFLRKNVFLISVLFLFSAAIVSMRLDRDGLSTSLEDMYRILEYHIVQPFLFSQKIDGNELSLSSYPLQTVVESFLFPFYKIFFGIGFSDIIYGMYDNVFNEFTLYSYNGDKYYNAFVTFFPFVYSETGVAAPLFVFVFLIFIFNVGMFLRSKHLRIKYFILVSILIYFSLFTYPVFAPGALLVLFFMLTLGRLIHKEG